MFGGVHMIPKVIHYCWFGGNPLPITARDCIESWRLSCPDYEIIEWNESNFDVNAIPYTAGAYKDKKWAYVTDYARLKIVYEHGGIYLDTDVEVLKSLDPFLEHKAFFGTQSPGWNALHINSPSFSFCKTKHNDNPSIHHIPIYLMQLYYS